MTAYHVGIDDLNIIEEVFYDFLPRVSDIDDLELEMLLMKHLAATQTVKSEFYRFLRETIEHSSNESLLRNTSPNEEEYMDDEDYINQFEEDGYLLPPWIPARLESSYIFIGRCMNLLLVQVGRIPELKGAQDDLLDLPVKLDHPSHEVVTLYRPPNSLREFLSRPRERIDIPIDFGKYSWFQPIETMIREAMRHSLDRSEASERLTPEIALISDGTPGTKSVPEKREKDQVLFLLQNPIKVLKRLTGIG